MDGSHASASIARRRSRASAARGQPAAEVFRDDHVWIRFAARPTSGPQVPHDRDEFYIVASGTARYRWDGGETMIGPGDMMFAAAHTPHGYDQFLGGLLGLGGVLRAAKACGEPMTDDGRTLPVAADAVTSRNCKEKPDPKV